MSHTLRKKLITGFERPLPGAAAQYRLAHVVRQRAPAPPADVRKAAVLALFYPAAITGTANLIFIRRSSREVRDKHAGQIGFPGGSVEAGDDSLRTTALRETEEEIGVSSGRINVLGRLTELYIPVSNFLVYPFVGWADQRPGYTLQETEVDEVIEVPFPEFLAPDARRTMDKELVNGMRLKGVPYWHVGGENIWGATAMITSELVEMVRE